MKAWKERVAVLAGAILFGVATSAVADQRAATGDGSGRGMMGGHGSAAPAVSGMGLGTMLEGLNLTGEQRAQLQPLDDELFRKQWEITGKAIEARRNLRRQSSMEQRDDKAIAEAHKILQELREQRQLAESQTWEKLESILTPEQREQLRSRQHDCTGGQA